MLAASTQGPCVFPPEPRSQTSEYISCACSKNTKPCFMDSLDVWSRDLLRGFLWENYDGERVMISQSFRFAGKRQVNDYDYGS